MGAKAADLRRPGRHGRPDRHLREPPQPQPPVGEQLGKGRKLDDILDEMHMVAEGVNTATVALELAETPRPRPSDLPDDRQGRRG